MIDGVKILVENFDETHLLSCNELNFLGQFNEDTGEVVVNSYGTEVRIAEYKGLKFILKKNRKSKNRLLITGSLHKYFNQGLHNANDFHFEDFLEVILDLSKKYQLDPSKCILQNLEFAVNILPPVPSTIILKGLLHHKNKPFKRISMEGADYYQVMHTRFYIKVYDKELQFPQFVKPNTQMLRIEMKYVVMLPIINKLNEGHLIDHNYFSLQDLSNIKVWNELGDILLKKWDEVLMYDYTLREQDLPESVKKNIDKWQNPHFWEGLDKRKRNRQKESMHKAIANYSDQTQSNIHKLVETKLIQLRQECRPSNQVEKEIINTCEQEKVGPSNSIYKSVHSPVLEELYQKYEAEYIETNCNELICQDDYLPF